MWQFKVLYYRYTMRMEARATWHCATSTRGDGRETYSNPYVILICTCTEHYHRHLPQRVRRALQTRSDLHGISVSRCHFELFRWIFFSRKIFVPCCRAFYLCVLVRSFALASIFRVFFFSFLPFFLLSYEMAIAYSASYGGIYAAANGEILHERNFPNDEMHNSNKM